MADYDDDQQDPKPAFGKWLLTQRDRGDWVDGIADAARADRTFPKNGDRGGGARTFAQATGRR